MNDVQADRLFDFMLSRLENRLGRKILANFSKISNLIKEVIENNGTLAGNVAILQNQQELENILLEAYQEGIIAGGTFTRRDLEEAEEEDESSLEELLLLLLLWRNTQASIQAQRITQTTIRVLEKVMDAGKAKGLVGQDLSKYVAREMNRLNRGRISTIANSEIGEAFSVGSHEVANEISKKYTLLKRWRSRRNSVVRDTHRRADRRYTAEPIPLNQFFEVGSSSAPYPKYALLPLREKANCYCYVRYVKVINIKP